MEFHRPRSLILGAGGGTRGAWCVPILDRIAKTTEVAAMFGTSINAVHSLAVTTGHADLLEGIWLDLDGQQDFMRANLPFDGLHSLRPLRRLMERQRWSWPTAEMRVGIVWWDTMEHEIVLCNGRPMDQVFDLAIGSASIAGIHDRWAFAGRLGGDGGHFRALPLPPGRRYREFDEVHALVCRPWRKPLPKANQSEVNGPIEQLLRFIDYQVHLGVQAAVQELRDAAKANPRTRFYLYAPRTWVEAGPTFERNDRLFRALTRSRLRDGRVGYANRERL